MSISFRSILEVSEEKNKSSESTPSEGSDGIKLFSHSKSNFAINDVDDEQQIFQGDKPDLLAHRKKSRKKQNSKAQLESVAVSAEWVLEQKGVYGPNDTKSKVIPLSEL